MLSLGFEEVAALTSGDHGAPSLSGGALGGGGRRVSPRLALNLTSAGAPRLPVQLLQEHDAALAELSALRSAARKKRDVSKQAPSPSPALDDDAKVPAPPREGADGLGALVGQPEVVGDARRAEELATENEQLRRLLASPRLPSVHLPPAPPPASVASLHQALEAQALRTDQLFQFLAGQMGALAEKVGKVPSGPLPPPPAVAKEKPGTLPFLEPANKRTGPIDLTTQRVGLYFYDSSLRIHGGARQSLATRIGSKIKARSYNEMLSLSVALDMAVAGLDALGAGDGGAQVDALLDVVEVLVRRWICILYAALHKNDWASANGFLHPRVRDTFLPAPLLASLGQQMRAQDFLDKRLTGLPAVANDEDDEEGDGIDSLPSGVEAKASPSPNSRGKASKKQ